MYTFQISKYHFRKFQIPKQSVLKLQNKKKPKPYNLTNRVRNLMRGICLLYLNNNDPFDEINVTNRMNRNLMKTGLPFESFGKSIYDLMKTGLQFANRKSLNHLNQNLFAIDE